MAPIGLLAIVVAAIAASLGLRIQAAQAARLSAGVLGIASVALEKPLQPGARTMLHITAQILPGWHINSNRPKASYYIPTRLSVITPDKVTAGEVEYPPARDEALEFAGTEKLSVFTGAAVFRIPLVASADLATSGTLPATITIDYQACDNRRCLRPASVSRTVDLRMLGLVLAVPKSTTTASSAPLAIPGADLEETFARHGYVLGFLIVLLGGLALNLTPCVYPLIGVTIAYFGNQGDGSGRVVILALVYVLGIAAMFSGVGVAVALSGGLFGAALQNPYLLAGIAAVLLVLAASSFGLFMLRPPQLIARWAGTARPGYAGSFLMGLGMGVVAAPCIGPIVLGLLLSVQHSGSPLFGFALFFTLAVGLGLPYIGLAMAAGSIRRLPRSGEWLGWIEQLFGFALIGLAAYFLDPVVPGHVMLRALPYYAAAAGVYLGLVTRAGRTWRPFLVIRSAFGVAALVALVYLAIPRARRPELIFDSYTGHLLATATNQHRPVLLDFSADWCIPCHEMESTTFRDPAVIEAASRFVRVRADLTAQNERNKKIIAQFNIMGVPTVVLIDSRGRIRKQTVGYVGPAQMLADLHSVD